MHDLRGTDGGLPPIACDLLPLSRAESCTALQDHPPNVYLREDYLTAKINSWVARLFDLAHVQRTVEALADADELAGGIETQAQFRRRIAAAESTMERLRRAIEVGHREAAGRPVVRFGILCIGHRPVCQHVGPARGAEVLAPHRIRAQRYSDYG